jgi:hypothetical protein
MAAMSDPLPKTLKEAKTEIKQLRKAVARLKYYVAKLEAKYNLVIPKQLN